MNEKISERSIKELNRAKRALKSAKILLEKKLFEDCVSRAYYIGSGSLLFTF